VIDEATAEPRAILLRRGGRMVVMRNATALSLDGDELVLEEERLVVIDTATWSLGPETESSWFGSRLGFHFTVETLSRPRDELDFALRVRGGVGITLAADDAFADHLVVGTSFEGASWSNGGADVHLGAGLFVEAGIGLGDQRLRGMVRALPGWSFPDGCGWGVEATLGLHMVLGRGAGARLRTALAARWDLPIPNAWELTMGVLW
jgi:hypothetical protein